MLGLIFTSALAMYTPPGLKELENDIIRIQKSWIKPAYESGECLKNLSANFDEYPTMTSIARAINERLDRAVEAQRKIDNEEALKVLKHKEAQEAAQLDSIKGQSSLMSPPSTAIYLPFLNQEQPEQPSACKEKTIEPSMVVDSGSLVIGSGAIEGEMATLPQPQKQ